MLSLTTQQRQDKGKEQANMLTSTPVDPAAGAGVVSLIVSLILGCSGVEEGIPMNTSYRGQEEWCIGRFGWRLHWFATCLHAKAMRSMCILSLGYASSRLPSSFQSRYVYFKSETSIPQWKFKLRDAWGTVKTYFYSEEMFYNPTSPVA